MVAVDTGHVIICLRCGISGISAFILPIIAGRLYLAGGEVDLTVGNIVNTADVQHQLVIYKDPNIIVTGEAELHVRAVGVHVLATAYHVRQIEGDLIGHAVPEVDLRAVLIVFVIP